MCCFTGKTEVHGTTIFARFTSPETQALVYQMQYSASEPTAMILPLPIALPAGEASVTWKNLKAFPEIFAKLDLGFPPDEAPSGSKSAGVTNARSMIEVHDVGDFIASFVPSVDDFDRVDPRFAIKKDVWSHIPAYADYGFAVFQLKELTGTPHPIAFEFRTRMRDKLFFPTVHIHDGTVHANDEFDHVLYLQDRAFDDKASSYDGPDHVDSATGWVRSKSKAGAFAEVGRSSGLIDGDLLVHRTTMSGTLPNVDTTVTPTRPAMSTGCARCDVTRGPSSTLGPSGVAIAGLAWIIRRRETLRPRDGRRS